MPLFESKHNSPQNTQEYSQPILEEHNSSKNIQEHDDYINYLIFLINHVETREEKEHKASKLFGYIFENREIYIHKKVFVDVKKKALEFLNDPLTKNEELKSFARKIFIFF